LNFFQGEFFLAKVEDFIKKHKQKFLRVKCNSCGNEQNIYGAASSDVKCLVCNQLLAESSASQVNLKAKLVKELE